MKSIPVAAVITALALVLACCAQEARDGEQGELVPPPKYNPPFGEASATASL